MMKLWMDIEWIELNYETKNFVLFGELIMKDGIGLRR